MSIKNVNPYIHFNGSAESAIQLYRDALGAKTECIMRYRDVPGMKARPEHQDLVMHAQLRIGEAAIMVSDTTPDRPVPAQGNVQVALEFAQPADLVKAFDTLSDGGQVAHPVHDTFWGGKLGMLIDPFGVRWALHCTDQQQA